MKSRDIIITNRRGQHLSATLNIPTNPHEVVILVPGLTRGRNSPTVKAIEAQLLRRGIGSLRLDLAGCGDSDGDMEEFTISRASQDILDSVKHLDDEWGIATFAACGVSSGATCVLAACLQVSAFSAIALLAPVANYPVKRQNELGVEGIAKWREDGAVEWTDREGGMHRLGWPFYVDSCRWVIGPSTVLRGDPSVLLLHGTEDTNTPLDHSLAISRIAKGSVTVFIPGADHFFGTAKGRIGVESIAASWLRHVLQVAEGGRGSSDGSQ
jgi:pimeloyl-ACP methyl ester carboxylesterase